MFLRRPSIEEGMFTSLEQVPDNTYKVVLADPPWTYNDLGTRMAPAYEGKQRKSGRPYRTMSLEDICGLGDTVRRVAAVNSILLLWSTHPLKETHPWKVISAWGYRYSTAIPWVKARWDTKSSRFIYNIGGGHTVRSCSEELLVCIRGKVSTLVADRGIPGAIITPARRRHSSKPDEQYTIAERLAPGGPYLEMFARDQREGWDAWGDQL